MSTRQPAHTLAAGERGARPIQFWLFQGQRPVEDHALWTELYSFPTFKHARGETGKGWYLNRRRAAVLQADDPDRQEIVISDPRGILRRVAREQTEDVLPGSEMCALQPTQHRLCPLAVFGVFKAHA